MFGFKKRRQNSLPTAVSDPETRHLAELQKKLSGFQTERKQESPARKKVRGFFAGRSFRNTFLAVLSLFLLGGYTIFFTSSLWLPYSGNYSFTAPGSSLEFANHRTVTLDRWDYSPQQNLMEVELEIDNPNFDGLDQYVCDVLIRTGSSEQSGSVKTVIAQDDFFVLHIQNVPKSFTEISLRIQMKGNSVPGTAKLFTNKEEIREVPVLSEKTKSEYLKDRVLALTDEYQEQIGELERTNQELQAKIENIKAKNTQLEQDKKYLTEHDIEITNERISSNESQIKALQEQIIGNESAVTEYRLKIQKAQEKAADIASEIQKENQMQAGTLRDERS